MKKSDVSDLIVTALEGGSNYWYNLPDLTMVPKRGTSNLALSERIVEAAYNGIEIPVSDVESEDDKILGYVNKENIERGIVLFRDKHKRHYADLLKEEWDATTADVFFQLVVMGEVIFG